MGAVKVATCCYCGTRAALVLRGNTRHELGCSNCGAPLSRLKMLPNPVPATPTPAPVQRRTGPQTAFQPRQKKRYEKPKKRKYRKGFWRKVIEEIWDEIEDIFD